MSNCWLLLLSPQLQNFFQERKLSPTNALLLSVLVEVSCDSNVLSKTIAHVYVLVSVSHHRCSVCSTCWSWLNWFCGYWFPTNRPGSAKRGTTLSSCPCRPWSSRFALKPSHLNFSIFFWSWRTLYLSFRSCRRKTPDCISRVGVPLHAVMCWALLQPEDRGPKYQLQCLLLQRKVKPPAESSLHWSVPLTLAVYTSEVYWLHRTQRHRASIMHQCLFCVKTASALSTVAKGIVCLILDSRCNVLVVPFKMIVNWNGTGDRAVEKRVRIRELKKKQEFQTMVQVDNLTRWVIYHDADGKKCIWRMIAQHQQY